jgi:hypothetical protein
MGNMRKKNFILEIKSSYIFFQKKLKMMKNKISYKRLTRLQSN